MRDKELLTIDAPQVMTKVRDLAAQIADYVAAGPNPETESDSPYADM